MPDTGYRVYVGTPIGYKFSCFDIEDVRKEINTYIQENKIPCKVDELCFKYNNNHVRDYKAGVKK